jgi:hypothetical protein
VLQLLSGVSSTPVAALGAAAEVIAERLGVALCR